MAVAGRVQERGVPGNFHGKSLWRFSARPAVSPDARHDRRIRTQSDCRPDAPWPFAQSPENGISAVGVPGVRLALYSETGWPAPAGRNPSQTGCGGAGHVSLVDARTADHAADCQTV